MPIAVCVVFPWENVYLQDLRQAPAQEWPQRVAFRGKLNDTCVFRKWCVYFLRAGDILVAFHGKLNDTCVLILTIFVNII